MLEEIPLSVKRNMWFQYDTAMAHFAHQVQEILPPLTMITGLDRVGQWLGLPGHQTSYQWTSSCGAHTKALILKQSYCLYCWGSINHQAATWHFWAHTSVSPSLSSAVYWGQWLYVWTFSLNWDKIQLFFSEPFGGFAWFPTWITPNLTVRSTAKTHLRYSSLTINLCFGPPYHLMKFGLEFFCTCRYLQCMKIIPFIVPRLISLLCQVPEPKE